MEINIIMENNKSLTQKKIQALHFLSKYKAQSSAFFYFTKHV